MSLAYFEWCADKAAASDDREAWAEANPALGVRISEESIERERGSMDDADFRRERLGIWNEDSEGSVIEAETWAKLADPRSKVLDPVAFAIDTTPDRSASAVGSAGRRADGLIHGEVVDHRPGTGWVVDRVVELVTRWGPCVVVLDPTGAAGAFIPELEEHGVKIKPESSEETKLEVVSARGATQACGGFHDLVTNDRLRHLDQTPLNAAVFGAKPRPLGDAWAWHRKDSSVDISPLVAVTLATYGHAIYGRDDDYDPLANIW